MKRFYQLVFFAMNIAPCFAQELAFRNTEISKLQINEAPANIISPKEQLQQEQLAQIKQDLEEQYGNDTITIQQILKGMNFSTSDAVQSSTDEKEDVSAPLSVTGTKSFLVNSSDEYEGWVYAEGEYKRDSTIQYSFNSDTDSTYSYRTIYKYDAFGNLILDRDYKWDSDVANWICYYTGVSEYDDEGNMLLYQETEWESDGTISWSYKEEYEYNDDDKVVFYQVSEWESDADALVNESKRTYEYNEIGKTELIVYAKWDSDAVNWANAYKYSYEYDETGNLILYLVYKWDNDSDSWVKYYQYAYEYNTAGKQTLYSYTNWETDGTVTSASYKYISEYNADGNKTLYLKNKWDSDGGDWIDSEKYEYEYDDEGNQSLYVYSKWDSDAEAWVYYSKYKYSYNQSGDLSLRSYYTYNTTTKAWVFSTKYKYEHEYDAANNKILYAYSTWSSSNEEWVYSFKYTYEYDEAGNRTLYSYASWDKNAEAWLNTWKYEYEYNQAGKQIYYAYYRWDSDENVWYSYNIYEYEYDEENNLLFNKRYSYDSDEDSLLANSSSYYYYTDYSVFASIDSISIGAGDLSIANFQVTSDATWLLSTESNWLALSSSQGTDTTTITLLAEKNTESDSRSATVRLFSGLSDTLAITVTQSGIEMSNAIESEYTSDNSLQVYPNPTEGLVYINSNNEEIESITVYTIAGKMVWTSNAISDNTAINLNDFDGNAFILQVETAKGMYSKKIIKR